MNYIIIVALVCIFTSMMGTLYGLYRYFDDLYNQLRDIIIEDTLGKYTALNKKLDKYMLEQGAGMFDIELIKLREQIQGNSVCLDTGIYNLRRSIHENKTEYTDLFSKVEKELMTLKHEIKALETNEKKDNGNCCKAGIQKSNLETHRIEMRIKRIENTLYTSEEKTKNNERVISVVVPDLADVPVADNLSFDLRKNNRTWPVTKELIPKSIEEKKLIKKYEDFESVVTPANIILLRKLRPMAAKRLCKIKDLYAQGEGTYIAIKNMKSELKEKS